MTPEEMQLQLIERHPEWADESHVAKLRVKGVFSLISQAHAEGVEQGRRAMKAELALRDIGEKAGVKDDLFSNLFGFK